MFGPVLLVLGGYLLGSVPVGLLVGLARGVDLREHGSRNIGATNAGRVLGRPFAFAVFLVDFGKGWLPVAVAGRWAGSLGADPLLLGLLCGIAAVLGHVFSLYLGFRGGKGVATASGVFTGLLPVPALMVFGVWLVVLLTTRWVALASVLAAWAFPVCGLAFEPALRQGDGRWVLAAAISVALLITLRHRSNIARMIRGEEPRIGTH